MKVVKVKLEQSHKDKEYHFYSPFNVKAGMYVVVRTRNGFQVGKVTEILDKFPEKYRSTSNYVVDIVDMARFLHLIDSNWLDTKAVIDIMARHYDPQSKK